MADDLEHMNECYDDPELDLDAINSEDLVDLTKYSDFEIEHMAKSEESLGKHPDLVSSNMDHNFGVNFEGHNINWQYLSTENFYMNNEHQDNLPKPEEHLEKFPDLISFDTPHNFEVTINGDNNNWQYNTQLQKIFIKMNAVMNVNISFKPLEQALALRAMILYSNPADMHLPIKRCANHRTNQDPNATHILKCCHPRAQYKGVEDGQIFKDRLSIVIPLGNPRVDEEGIANESINLEFACQNSCTSGINRKATCIVFTLEDQNCKILGKKVVQFKVCSCPKRDADRELGVPNKRKPGDEHHPHPRGKKPKVALVNGKAVEIKTEPDEEEDSPAPAPAAEQPATNEQVEITLVVPNRKVAKQVLSATFNAILGGMAIDKKTPSDVYMKCAELVQKQLKELKKNKQNN